MSKTWIGIIAVVVIIIAVVIVLKTVVKKPPPPPPQLGVEIGVPGSASGHPEEMPVAPGAAGGGEAMDVP